MKRKLRKFVRDEARFEIDGFSADFDTGAIFFGGVRRDHANREYRDVVRKDIRVSAHRLIWRLAYGHWPESFIDHINGKKSDNRLCNLRLASAAQNSQNASQEKNRLNATGVTFSAYGPKKLCYYRVSVRHNGKRVQDFASSFFSAVCAARLLRRLLHGEFAFENRG